MAKRPPLSKSETEIAKILWKIGEASARDVLGEVDPGRKLSFSTVQTYLTRMENKGYVSSRMEGRTKLFKSKARPYSVIKDAVDDFVGRLFDGDAMPLVRHLINDADPSSEEIAELRRLLCELEESEDELD